MASESGQEGPQRERRLCWRPRYTQQQLRISLSGLTSDLCVLQVEVMLKQMVSIEIVQVFHFQSSLSLCRTNSSRRCLTKSS